MVGNSVKLPDLSGFHFPLSPESGMANVVGIVDNQIITRHLSYPVKELKTHDIARLALIERYGKNGNIAFALVEGTGLKRGAFAISIAHDSHNVLVLGHNDDDMRFAAESLAEMEGGAVAVLNGKIIASMPLPIGGLISPAPAEVIAEQDKKCKSAVQNELGITLSEPLLTLSFLALPVIPCLKLTDQGLFDSENFQFVPLYFQPGIR